MHFSSFRCYSICPNIFLRVLFFWGGDFFNLTQNKHPFDLFRGPSAARQHHSCQPQSYIFSLLREEWKNQSLNFFNMYLLLFTSLSPPGGMWTWGLFNLSKQVSCSKSTSIYSTEDRRRGEISWLHEYPTLVKHWAFIWVVSVSPECEVY
jgi:hypothetical protein